MVYDPEYFSEVPLGATGLPDFNILAGLHSAAGYSSIVNQTYNQATETHTVGDLNLPALQSGALDDLNLQDILTMPEYFLLPLSTQPASLSDVQPVSENGGLDPVLPAGSYVAQSDPSYRFYPAPRAPLHSGQVGRWFFGESLSPTRASLVFATATTSATVRFGSLTAGGKPTWGPTVTAAAGARRVTGEMPPGAAYGLAVQVISGQVPSHQAVVTVGQRAYELDGALSAALDPAHVAPAGFGRGPPPLHPQSGPDAVPRHHQGFAAGSSNCRPFGQRQCRNHPVARLGPARTGAQRGVGQWMERFRVGQWRRIEVCAHVGLRLGPTSAPPCRQ